MHKVAELFVSCNDHLYNVIYNKSSIENFRDCVAPVILTGNNIYCTDCRSLLYPSMCGFYRIIHLLMDPLTLSMDMQSNIQQNV